MTREEWLLAAIAFVLGVITKVVVKLIRRK